MAYTISLASYNADFSLASAIDPALLNGLVAQREDLQLEQEDGRSTLTVWREDAGEWWPLLWIYPDHAYMNSNPLFEFGLYYDLASIAEALQACIVTEEGHLLYIPQYGFLYDPEEKIDVELEVGELQAEMVKTANLPQAIRHIVSAREQVRHNKPPQKLDGSDINAKMESKQHYVAIAILVVLAVVFVIKKC